MLFEEVPKFPWSRNVRWRKRLSALNIRHVEQLGSLLAANDGHLVLERFGVPVESVVSTLEPVLERKLGLSLDNPLSASDPSAALLTRDRRPMGHSLAEYDRFRELRFDSPVPRSAKPASRAKANGKVGRTPPTLFPAVDQGRRGTCVAFTVMAMFQGMRQKAKMPPVRLSTQYLYWRTKVSDTARPHEEGSSLSAALHTFQREGCCLEHQLEYCDRHDIAQSYRIKGHTPRTTHEDLRKLARRQRICGYRGIPNTVAAIKAELALDRPVGVGLALYQYAWYNAIARSRGEIAMPLLDMSAKEDKLLDTYLGGHAVALVGYQDNAGKAEEARPGGGYFIFRNSWGEDWAPHNDAASGYGFLPYEYVARFCVEAAVMDDLPMSAGKSSAAEVKTQVVSTTQSPSTSHSDRATTVRRSRKAARRKK